MFSSMQTRKSLGSWVLLGTTMRWRRVTERGGERGGGEGRGRVGERGERGGQEGTRGFLLGALGPNPQLYLLMPGSLNAGSKLYSTDCERRPRFDGLACRMHTRSGPGPLASSWHTTWYR